MDIGVVGLGKLGLPLSLVFAKAGFTVHGIDVSEARIKEIKSYYTVNCSEPKVTEYLQKFGKNLQLSTSSRDLKSASIIFLITQTPSTLDGYFDLEFVEKGVQGVHDANPDALIVVSSNINIGTTDSLSKIHKRVSYNPEFIRQGTIIQDFENPKFTVIGSYTREDGELIANIWKKVHNKPIYFLTPTEAEITKISLNVSYTLQISWSNTVGEVCEAFNADAGKVLDILYKDVRPYKPGLGFMGPCFPRDVICFKAQSFENSVESGYRLGSLLDELNDLIKERYLRKIKALNKKKIGILGVAYKPNVPYTYESQPLMIAQTLVTYGYEVFIHDPLAQESAKKTFNGSDKVNFCATVDECVDKAEAVFIGTANYSNVETTKPVINPWKTGILA